MVELAGSLLLDASASATASAAPAGAVADAAGPVRTVFIVGPPRSGTTLLAFLLAGAPRVLSLSEPFRLHEVFPRWGLRWLGRELRRKHGLRLGPTTRRASDDQVLNRLRGAVRENGLTTLIVKETFRSERAWSNLELLDGFIRAGEPVVGIIRHPYDCAVSTLKMFRLWRGIVGELVQFIVPDLPLFRGDADIARYTARSWNDFADWCARHRVFLVRYEDLARSPAETMAAVCRSCGMTFDPLMLDHRHPRGPFGGIGDPGLMTRPARPVSAKSVGRKRQLPRALRAILAQECAASGARFDYRL